MSPSSSAPACSISTARSKKPRSISGPRRLKVFWKITLPIILPAVISGWLLAFTLSLDDLVIASFTSGPGSSTLPIIIYSQVRLGVTPEINAICTVLIVLVATGVMIGGSALNRRNKATRQGLG